MRTILVGKCSPAGTFRLLDPDAPSEAEFEVTVLGALACAYPRYECMVFRGTFLHADWGSRRPDLALVAKDLSHWFIVEVELTSHSLDHHVLPQVRTFTFGEPQPDCVTVLSERLQIDRGRAETFLRCVPRYVAVVANRREDSWEKALRALPAQLLAVSSFKSDGDMNAVEIEGTLVAIQASLGFGTYSAVDRSLRFPPSVRIPRGEVQLVDENGAASTWLAVEAPGAVWLTKLVGTPDFTDRALVQVLRTREGRLLLRSRSLGI